MARMQDKVAIITGTASGMGLAGAKAFAREGAKVVMIDLAEEKLNKAADAIKADGGDVLAIAMDVSSAESWEKAVQQTVDTYGRVDALVNNAAIVSTSNAVDTDEAEWDQMMAINAKGVWLAIKNVIPQMQKQGGGAIVNIASISGLVGGKGSIAYSASKGAVLAMGRQVAESYAADSIRVNAISPGLIYTEMTSGGGTMTKEEAAKVIGGETPLPPHAGDAEDIAYGMLYLASDESKYVTGANIVIDGGWTVY